MTMLTCVDLFSGLGGWSRAFLYRGGWNVVKVDNEPEFHPHICADIFNLDPSILPFKPTVVLASPPCEKFSTNTIRLNWKKRRMTNHNVLLAVGLVAKTMHIIYSLQPTYWVVENPRGKLREVMGKPTVETSFAAWGAPNLKPTDLWGNFPEMDWPHADTWEQDGTRKIGDPAEAARIPYKLSDALRMAIEKELFQNVFKKG